MFCIDGTNYNIIYIESFGLTHLCSGSPNNCKYCLCHFRSFTVLCYSSCSIVTYCALERQTRSPHHVSLQSCVSSEDYKTLHTETIRLSQETFAFVLLKKECRLIAIISILHSILCIFKNHVIKVRTENRVEVSRVVTVLKVRCISC